MRHEAYDELDHLESTHWWFEGMRHITARLIEEAFPQRIDMKILDAGCGVGGNMTEFSRYGRVIGIDYSYYALQYAGKNHHGRLAGASVEALPFADNTFDLVTSMDVLVCAEVRDDQRAINEFARITRPNGYVLMRLAAMEALKGAHDTFVSSVRRYDAAPLREKLLKAGLTPVRLTYANIILLPAIFTLRKMQTLIGSQPSSDINPMPQPVNRLLISLLNLEAKWIGHGYNFPAGVSLYSLARKS